MTPPTVEEALAPATIPLGARVRYVQRIDREEHQHGKGHTWRAVPMTPGEGVFMGYRYKQTGSWQDDSGEYERYGTHMFWQERGRVKVALIVKDAWSGPWTVDPDGLEIITEVSA